MIKMLQKDANAMLLPKYTNTIAEVVPVISEYGNYFLVILNIVVVNILNTFIIILNSHHYFI